MKEKGSGAPSRLQCRSQMHWGYLGLDVSDTMAWGQRCEGVVHRMTMQPGSQKVHADLLPRKLHLHPQVEGRQWMDRDWTRCPRHHTNCGTMHKQQRGSQNADQEGRPGLPGGRDPWRRLPRILAPRKPRDSMGPPWRRRRRPARAPRGKRSLAASPPDHGPPEAPGKHGPTF